MPDHSHPTSHRRNPARPPRRKRFALPRDHHDELQSGRTAEQIEAFLEGPTRVSRAQDPLPGRAIRRPRALIPLDTRMDWQRALDLEDARLARYGRTASVLVVDVATTPPEAVDASAARIGAAIRAESREIDRVARVGPGRFHVLLPETDGNDATAIGERMARACRAALAAPAQTGVEIRTAAVQAVEPGSLVDALRRASIGLEG